MDDDLQRQLDEIKLIFIGELDAKLKTLLDNWQRVLEDASTPDIIANLHLISHSLVGSGATFGFDQLSTASRKLEQSIKPHAKEQIRLSPPIIKDIQPLVDAVHTEIQAITSSTIAAPEIQQTIETTPTLATDANIIYAVLKDNNLQQELQNQLTFYGIKISPFSCIESLSDTLNTLLPKAIIIETDQIEQIERLIEINSHRVPIIFLSQESHSLQHQIFAVRAGGIAYFKMPVDLFQVVDKLDSITDSKNQPAFKVLIIEDEVSLSQHYAVSLQSAGMLTCIVNNPCNAMNKIVEFMPDVILMDIYMPVCPGVELAKIIRQNDTFSGIPIMYLSTESDIIKKTEALSQGADDFLQKPIEPEHLILSVRSRAERYLTLRNLVIRDSLTGLLNHSHIKESIDFQAHSAERNKTPLCFAMIDIDHFKSVNDQYGHAMGDQVIKSLTHLLKQRLRKTDIIGRMGGEEF
ncbi:MAG: diguanylate cyclase, partial [Methylococcales bacterium]|nr:diguanylate cyclase [Methylococcales bacterium]